MTFLAYLKKNAVLINMNTIKTIIRYDNPDSKGRPAISWATPTTRGFIVVAANPTQAEVLTMWKPTTLSYPKLLAKVTPKGIKGINSREAPNKEPQREKITIIIINKGKSFPLSFSTTFIIPASIAPVLLTTATAPDVRNTKEIIPADNIIPSGMAFKVSNMPTGVFSIYLKDSGSTTSFPDVSSITLSYWPAGIIQVAIVANKIIIIIKK